MKIGCASLPIRKGKVGFANKPLTALRAPFIAPYLSFIQYGEDLQQGDLQQTKLIKFIKITGDLQGDSNDGGTGSREVNAHGDTTRQERL